jgi:type IV secretory pathway VirB2 component (pilin)
VKLENRAPAEGINASRENPLKELAWLLIGSIAAVVAIVFSISLAAQWIAPRIPYNARRDWRPRCVRDRAGHRTGAPGPG